MPRSRRDCEVLDWHEPRKGKTPSFAGQRAEKNIGYRLLFLWLRYAWTALLYNERTKALKVLFEGRLYAGGYQLVVLLLLVGHVQPNS